MNPFVENIEKATLENSFYRNVVYTIPNEFQLVYMAIPPSKGIPSEIHEHTTQFFRIEKGLGIAKIDGKYYGLNDGVSLVIPPGAKHKIDNVGSEPLKLYTIYVPPEHLHGKIEL